MNPHDLKKWRTDRELTMAELAPIIGTTQASLSRWENGLREIPAHVPIILFLLSVKNNRKKVEAFLAACLIL